MKKSLLSGIICASALAFSGQAMAQGTIYTIAGTGISGSSGDGGAANLATLSSPSGVAVDGSGNIYVADYGNHRIRMINSSGVISTIAGTGTFGYAGMGGPAISAGMEYPNSIFVDRVGNYYITDFFADCAYGVSGTTGHITNTCGHNSQGNDGDGGDAPLARMELPKQVWKDNFGNIILADYGNNRVRVVNGTTNIVTTATGGSTHGFSPDGTPAASCLWGSITGVCADASGNIYVSDGSNHVVRMIEAATGNVRTVAGTGTAGYSGDGGSPLSARLSSPGALFINAAGYLFICDGGANVVRVMNVYATGGVIKTLAGTGIAGFSGDGHSAQSAQLNQPSAVWESASGTIYIADMGNQRIRAIVRSGYKAGETGIHSTAFSDLNIFPNPSNGTINLIGVPENTTLEVYNMLGEQVYTQNIRNQHATVNLDVPSGLYNLVLRSAGDITSQRIVISK